MLRSMTWPFRKSLSAWLYAIRYFILRQLLLLESGLGLTKRIVLRSAAGYKLNNINYAVSGNHESLEVWLFHRGSYSTSRSAFGYLPLWGGNKAELFFRGVQNFGSILANADYYADRAAVDHFPFILSGKTLRAPGKFGFHAGLTPELGNITQSLFHGDYPPWYGRPLVKEFKGPIPEDTTTAADACAKGDPHIETGHTRNYSEREVSSYRSWIHGRKDWKRLLLWRAYWYIPGFHKLVKVLA